MTKTLSVWKGFKFRISYLNLFFVFIFIYIAGSCYWIFTQNVLEQSDFAARASCPACFGQSVCTHLYSDRIKLSNVYRFSLFEKNVIPATFSVSEKQQNVLLKRLGTAREFEDLDFRICVTSNLAPNCDTSSVVRTMTAVRELDSFKQSFKYMPSKLFYCPSTRLVQRMLAKYKEVGSHNSDSRDVFSQLWTTAHISAEPLLLQTFPAAEGWPFPRYYGACGRLVMVENAGKPLDSYYHAPWNIRVDLALQLLVLADNLTNNADDFALYMLNATYDSFVVRDNGHVVLVDLQNILVVDKQAVKSAKPDKWEEEYQTPYTDCSTQPVKRCHSYSERQLCSHVTSDHNYYVICHFILSHHDDVSVEESFRDGLLHDIPDAVSNDWDLEYLLSECVNPHRQRGRLQVLHKLIDAFTNIHRHVKQPHTIK